ncbi:hypothetical protein K457DRAFT_139223 [Linnemannia elongata AG-77]|uniref:Uncharacterized protein n=1 Tax=Linnemannia elongata AG-77 TaxID=1314771 RepID=A0A197JU17_9FUNG|nr:hypothetical protein K457DRAFT_139223 [Linnemannia elongata AG-77]
MARTNPPPALSIKTFFTPSTFVCLLALSACTPTSALPISTPHSSSTVASSIPSDSKDTTSTNNNAINARSIEPTAADSSSTPFRTVSRPITIHVDLTAAGSSESSTPYERLIRHTEQQEQLFRDRESEALARLAQEQDELEKAEQDRDQLLDNEEEEQLAQDPETVRRRQEESMGLWMTEAELDAASVSYSTKVVVADAPLVVAASSIQEEVLEPKEAFAVAESEKGVNEASAFDLYADDFKEVEALSAAVAKVGRKQHLRRLAPEYTEEEMLQWPIVNLAQFEDRQDEVQDEYEEDQIYQV